MLEEGIDNAPIECLKSDVSAMEVFKSDFFCMEYSADFTEFVETLVCEILLIVRENAHIV